MGSHERKASPGFTDYIRFQHVRSTPVLRLIQQKLLINPSIKMRYSFALLAGVAAASYIPEVPSSSAAPSSSAKGYGYGDYKPSSSAAPSSSAKGYGGDYWPKSSSSSSVKAPYVPKSSSAPYKPTYTTIECEGPTTFTYGSKTYSAETKTSWVVECTDEPYVPKPEPVKPTYEPKPVYPSYTPTKPAYTPSASVTKTGPLQVTANAAVNNVAGAGAALAGVFGAVAYLL